jgi:hypothetical protein
MSYHVRVVPKTPVVNDVEGPKFDVVRLIIHDYTNTQPVTDSTRWIKGNSPLTGTVSLPEIDDGSGPVKGLAYKADYVVTIADAFADTSSSFHDAAPLPMKFTVWNRTENRRAEVLFFDNDDDATLSRNDQLYIVEKNAKGVKQIAWLVTFTASERYAVPAPGDQFLIKIGKPFTSNDAFEFRSMLIGGVQDQSPLPGCWSLSQNYPNPFNPSTHIRYSIAQTQMVHLAVFDVLGREVTALVHERMKPGTYSVEWDAANAASGVYFYRLNAGNYSETKKLVLTR